MRRVLPTLSIILVSACNNAPEPDAYGNFEATEVVVSSETGGQIQSFLPVEGMRLEHGATVAVIDTTELALERQQVLAQRNATGSRGDEVTAQIRVLEVQRDIARRTLDRTHRLFSNQAATVQQVDAAERDYRTLVAQIAAVRAQRRSTSMDVASAEARVEQIVERIAKSTVRNPQRGTVLAVYARSGEIVQPGQQLYRIADLDTLVLRAYISGDQLGSIKLGQRVDVRIDTSTGSLRAIAGTVTWISPTAEFTPTPVQTRDERADLVYAVKISVPNSDGALKIGMPADVTFGVTAPGDSRK